MPELSTEEILSLWEKYSIYGTNARVERFAAAICEAGAKSAHKRIVELEHGLEIATEIINSHVEEYEVERAVSDRLLEALNHLSIACEDSDDCQYGTLSTSFVQDIIVAAIAEIELMRQERKEKPE